VASLWTEGWQGQGNEQGDSRGPRLSESLPECGRGTVCRDCSSTFLSVGGAPCAATPSRASLWREGWQGQGNEQGDSRVPRLSESLPECGRGTVCRDSSSPFLSVGGAPCAATPSVASLWREGWQGQGDEQGESRGTRCPSHIRREDSLPDITQPQQSIPLERRSQGGRPDCATAWLSPKTWVTVRILAVLCLLVSSRHGLAATETSGPLHLRLFASATCAECAEVKRRVLPRMRQRFGDRIQVTHHLLDDIEGFKLLLLYEKHYAIDDQESLKIFLGTVCLSGKAQIEAKLEQTIAEQLAAGAITPTPEQLQGKTAQPGAAETADAATADAPSIQSRFETFKPGAILLAGLIDGINPCAFATLVFLVSLLGTLHKSRGQILLVGSCFSFAVFVTYLGLGFGAFHAVKAFSVAAGISRILTLAIAAFTLVLGILSLRDAWAYSRTGKAESISLKLPAAVRLRANRLISGGLRTRHLAPAALGLGVLVSLLESLCTGQVYLPAISLLVQDEGLASRAFLWLFLYNLMFILPLLLVFALTAFGLSSKTLLSFSKRHTARAKLLLGLLFIGLAALLVATTI